MDDYTICIANQSHIDELVNIGIESDTESCPNEISSRLNSNTDFYVISCFQDKIIGKCLIKKCCLTEDDDEFTYYLREVYKNQLHNKFKMKTLISYAISVIHSKNITLKLFVDILNTKAIQLYKNLNFNLVVFNKLNLFYTDEYIRDKTYNKSKLDLTENHIRISSKAILIRPDRKIPYYKFMLKVNCI